MRYRDTIISSIRESSFRSGLVLLLAVNAIALAETPSTKKPGAHQSDSSKSTDSKRQKETANDRETGGMAATPRDIVSAPCKQGAPSIARMENYLAELGQTENGKQKIKAAFRDLLPPDAGVPSTDKYKACEDDLCRAKAAFGDAEGVQLLYLRLRYNINSSHYATPRADVATRANLDRILSSVLDYPPFFFPLSDRQIFIAKFKRGYMIPETQPEKVMGEVQAFAVGRSHVFLYDFWEKQDSEALQEYTLSHELAHIVAAELGGRQGNRPDLSSQWLEIGGWKLQGLSDWVFDQEKMREFPSVYSFTNPQEDFAESVVAYRYRARELYKRSPERYRYIKEVLFQGIEFTSEQACNLEKTHQYRAARRARDHSREIDTAAIPPGKILPAIKSQCGEFLVRKLDPSETPLSSTEQDSLDAQLKACIEKVLDLEAAKQMLGALDLTHPELVAHYFDRFYGNVIAAKTFPALSKEQLEPLMKSSTDDLRKDFVFNIGKYVQGSPSQNSNQSNEDYCADLWKHRASRAPSLPRAPEAIEVIRKLFEKGCLEALAERSTGDLRAPTQSELADVMIPENVQRKQKERIENINKFLAKAENPASGPVDMIGLPAVRDCLGQLVVTSMDAATKKSFKDCLVKKLTHGAPPLTESGIDLARFNQTLDGVTHALVDYLLNMLSQRMVAQAKFDEKVWDGSLSAEKNCERLVKAMEAAWVSDLDLMDISIKRLSAEWNTFSQKICVDLAASKPFAQLTADEVFAHMASLLNVPPSTPAQP